MATSISTAMQNALNDDLEGHLAAMFTFALGSGTYGFWTGPGSINYNSLDYHAAGSLFDQSEIETDADGSITEVKLKLSTSPDKGLDGDVLVSLFDEDWHLRRVTIALAVLNPSDPYTVIGTEVLFRGRIESAEYVEGINSDYIEASCVSVSMDLSRVGGLYRNAATQKRFDSSDTSLKKIGTLKGPRHKSIKWSPGK